MASSSHDSATGGPMDNETGFQRDVLAVIASLDGDPKGLAIKDVLEERYDGEINHGRLYPNLDTLVERGLVNKGAIDRRTNSYGLSSRGRRVLEDDLEWRQEALST